MYVTEFFRFSVATGSAALICVAVDTAGIAQSPAPDVSGVWIDHTGQGAVEIAPCGSADGNSAAGRLCGRVVWLKNPDHKSKSGRRICGTQILGDLRQRSAKHWEDGWIYNPEDEERFDASLQLASADTLKVTGYLGIKLLGETFTWKRATESLQRCTEAQSAHVR